MTPITPMIPIPPIPSRPLRCTRRRKILPKQPLNSLASRSNPSDCRRSALSIFDPDKGVIRMNQRGSAWGRRQFIGVLAAGTWATQREARGWSFKQGSDDRMALSFYCDDTGPHTAGTAAFRTFLDYCSDHEIAGESSLILGSGRRSMARNPTPEEQAFFREVARARECGIDTHMELMTHRGLFDFEQGREPADATHEGLWLHEPGVTEEDYRSYFAGIIGEADRVGLGFTGLTWPGCGCGVCSRRYAELRAAGDADPNPNVWRALLRLAREGRFLVPVISCFFKANETAYGVHRRAAEDGFGVYDLMPNARDHFGIWENDPGRVNPDYYISEDGKAGIVIRHLSQRAPYCIWYAHWQGLNPGNGVGWDAFRRVVDRIRKHLGDRVVWMRPSDMVMQYHETGRLLPSRG